MSNNCTISCPYCSKDIDIIQAMELQAGNDWTGLIVGLHPSMIGALLRYLELFKPKSQSLRWSRRLSLTQEIMPMIKSGTVTRNGITHAMPPQIWEAEMLKLVANRPSTLVLPLTSNGYLLSIMIGRVEKSMAIAESKLEESKRNRGHSGLQTGMQQAVEQVKAKNKPPEGWRPATIPKKLSEDNNG